MTTDDDHEMITGLVVSVLRDGKRHSVDIARLTDAELYEFFHRQHEATAARWAQALARWIRENVIVVKSTDEEQT